MYMKFQRGLEHSGLADADLARGEVGISLLERLLYELGQHPLGVDRLFLSYDLGYRLN